MECIIKFMDAIPFFSQQANKTIQSLIEDLKSPLGLTPSVQGSKIVIRIPSLDSEQREKYIKIVGEKVEEKKVTIRNHRDNARKIVKTSFEKKEVGEDEKYRW